MTWVRSRSSGVWLPPDSYEKERAALLSYLKENCGVWVRSRVLAAVAGFPVNGSCVQLRKAVRVLRFAGYPINSGNNGFKLCGSSDEIDGLVSRLHARAAEISATADAIKLRNNR